MHGERELSVDCRGRRASVEIVVSGPDVVFVGAAVPMMWARPAAHELAGKGFRVINFDYGSGHSKPESRTALGQVPDVLAVMEATDTKGAGIVGLSRGAMTAYGLAAESSAVKELVLAFPVAGFDDTKDLAEPDPTPRTGETEEQFLRRSLGKVFSADFLDAHFDQAVRLVTTPGGAVQRVDRADEDRFPAQMTVTVPTLVVEGGADQIVSSRHPARYLAAVPGSEHVVVAGAEHGWLMEDPAAFAGILADLFARSSRSSSPRS